MAARSRRTRHWHRPIPFADRHAGWNGEDPLAFLADRSVFGDLPEDERFTSPYRRALASLRGRGARATLAALVDGAGPGS